jgi:uncharacterized damage-inducible protein DinB
MDNRLLNEFKQNAVFRLEEGQRMIHLAFAKIGEEQLWEVPAAISLSLGNQLLHICGNMTQYAIASLSELPDQREREKEFATKEGFAKEELLQQLDQTIAQAISSINQASAVQYTQLRKVQGFEFSGVGVVLHAIEHFSYHVGQIAFWIKLQTKEDLGFYDHHDLTQLNE